VSRPFLPYGRQTVDEADIAAVAAVLRSDWLTTGPVVAQFESALAARVGARYAVACSSGTAALHLAAVAAGLGPGDRAVVPAMTFLATANAVRFAGGEVSFTDVDAETGLMTESGLEAEIAGGERIKAVLPVHLKGQTVDMPALARLAAKHGLTVIEDASHALGASYRDGAENVPAGSCRHSDMTVFSFHPVKTITMGEGGAVTTNDRALYDRLVRLRAHGITREAAAFQDASLALDPGGGVNPWYYEMQELGFNYRVSDIHCALGLSQLGKLDSFVGRRRALADEYDRRLASLAPAVRAPARVANCEPAWHLYAPQFDFEAFGVARGALMRRLAEQGIGTQVHYIPLHLQPYYAARYGARALPGAVAYYRRTLSLPLFASMSEDDVARVVDALAGCQGG